MIFRTDTQTIEDLNLLGKFKKNSIFSQFNQCYTAGGERALEKMFNQPLTDPTAINNRSRIFQLFQQVDLDLPFDTKELELAILYLQGESTSTWLGNAMLHGRRKLNTLLGIKQEDEQLKLGFIAWLTILRKLRPMVVNLHDKHGPILQHDPVLSNAWLQDEKALANFNSIQSAQQLTLSRFLKADNQIRGSKLTLMQDLLALIYQLDVYISVAKVAKARRLNYAEAFPADDNRIHAKNIRHLAITGAVGNDISFDAKQNLFFLTGANMAGKSTFMKSFGISMYLAHMGFPVPADVLQFAVKDGLFTSINVSDNLNMGYSHYYAEVLRVKQVATAVSEKSRLIVIFDELFKGTNVKDAFEATYAVTKAFQRFKQCFYLISTHIVEVGEELRKHDPAITFRYMPTVMLGSTPTYPYIAKEGISSDKHGMILIENEGILSLLEKPQASPTAKLNE
ncbi:MutS-related protein [Sphingobacterium sp. Mn56C]|uniref:MutS-related protein n=1 Tax=Sphingobacterium sp. Mn56C TaxID=3395261 RepID=UPI003BCD5B52